MTRSLIALATAVAVVFLAPPASAVEVPKPAPLEEMVANRVAKVARSTDEFAALKMLPRIKQQARRIRAEWVESYEDYQARIARQRAAEVTADAAQALEAAYDTDPSGVCWDCVASCESGGDWSINTGNGYYGGLQFSYSTWHAYGGGQYAEYPHLATREQQIAVASGMALSHWPHCGALG